MWLLRFLPKNPLKAELEIACFVMTVKSINTVWFECAIWNSNLEMDLFHNDHPYKICNILISRLKIFMSTKRWPIKCSWTTNMVLVLTWLLKSSNRVVTTAYLVILNGESSVDSPRWEFFIFLMILVKEWYSVDSIKHTVLLKVLLQIFLLVSIKSTVHWKFSRQINFAYCLY